MNADIEIWKIRKLIKSLESARGNGTSMISLIIPPKGQVSLVSKMLTDEQGTATNIKSRVNRLSVLGAITSTQQRLKMYRKVPKNGLVLYVGTALNEDGKEKKMVIDFEPFKPINTSLYLCDNKFHTEPLSELLKNDDCYGFIIVDGSGVLFGTVAGNNRRVLQEFTVDLPKKHGRGGQSALRFARLRLEARHNYIRKIAESATHHFISNNQPNIKGLILAGSAELKNDLSQSNLFDSRLSATVIKIVDVSYGGLSGFSEAISLSAETLANVKFIKEQKLLSKFFEEVALDSGKYCFGIQETLGALEIGAVETLIVWEDMETIRYTVRNGEEEEIVYKDTDIEGEIVDSKNLTEWLVENYDQFGVQLEFVSDKSQEGFQFCQGFGGIGALLRYQIDLSILNPEEDVEESSEESDDPLDDVLDLDGFL